MKYKKKEECTMKKAFALLMAMALIMSLAACGGSTASSEAASASASTSSLPAASAEVSAVEEDTEPVAQAPAESVQSAEEAAPSDTAETVVLDGDTPLSSVLENTPEVSLPLTEDSPTYQIWMCSPGAVGAITDFAESNEAFAELQKRTGVDIEFVM